MAVFESSRTAEPEEILGSDAATRALSVTVVDNDFLARVYENLASVYDFTFGPALHPGRVDAIQRMAIKPRDRVLEVGVGTGINAALYPTDCSVTGIDLSGSMLERARERIARKGVRNVRLNHFRSKSRLGAWLERIIAPAAKYLGFKSDLDLPAFLVQAELEPVSIEKVNVPRIWSLVTCVKE